MLTQQEILETRKRLGIPEGGVASPATNSAAQNVARRRQLAAEYDAKQKEEKPSFISRAGEALKERGKDFKETFSKAVSGEISPLESGARFIGDTIGAVGDVAGAAISPQIEKLAQKEWAKPAFEKIAQGMEAYEGWKAESPANDRVGEMLESVINIADLFGATAAGKATAKTVAKVGGEVADTVSDVTKKVSKTVGDITPQATKVVKDIVPTRGEVISGQITKALDLTQGDVSNIKLSTKNDVGEWISNKNLIGGNKKETITKIRDFTDTQYKTVREEISKVPTVYKPATVPRVRESLIMLSDELQDVLGQEKALSEVSTLLQKKTYKLEDVQRVKELLDDQFDLYKATGDVKAGQTKTGLANVRQELKTFIEKEVKDNTGADIRGMNNDVATGKSIQHLADKRSTRDFTRANVSLSDLGVFGTGSILATPLGGAAAFVIKRILETPTVRLKFAKFLKSLPKKEVEAIKNTLLRGEVPEQLRDFNMGAVPQTAYSEASKKIVSIFEQSKNQTKITRNFELGSFGRNHFDRKALEGKFDRFPETELKDTIKSIKKAYKASDNPKNYRSDNIAWISEMPNGEKRVIYTRKNKNNAEEIIAWHKITSKNREKYITDLSKNGIPDQNRTGMLDLEGQ